jgi:SAM-dependent methyltransferase/uncharacterized protein YbaR (Trm112 family)
MRPDLADRLRCPRCRQEGLALSAAERDEKEVRSGELTCEECGERRAIREGIADLLPPDTPGFVSREGAGLGRFAETMRADGWDRERILRLPDEPSGYWYAQGVAMNQTLGNPELDFQPGKRILDVGSNTCWAAATFARHRLDAVALDITPTLMQGLETAEWWMDEHDIYFERVLGVMFDLPFAADTFDYVWCCEVLHHNHTANLRQTMRELYRVLKPGGRLIVVNEPVRAIRDPKLNPGHEVAEYEGHEHAYLRRSYVRSARRAGFDVQVVGPWLHGTFTDQTFVIPPDMPRRIGLKAALTHIARRTPGLAPAVLAWRTYVTGTSLYMLGTKAGPSG